MYVSKMLFINDQFNETMKQKNTIKFTQFSERNPHIINCYICNKTKLLPKERIGIQKLKSLKKYLWFEPKQKLIYLDKICLKDLGRNNAILLIT